MNIHTRGVEQIPDNKDVNEALRVLRNWIANSDSGVLNSPDASILSRIVEKRLPL